MRRLYSIADAWYATTHKLEQFAVWVLRRLDRFLVSAYACVSCCVAANICRFPRLLYLPAVSGAFSPLELEHCRLYVSGSAEQRGRLPAEQPASVTADEHYMPFRFRRRFTCHIPHAFPAFSHYIYR